MEVVQGLLNKVINDLELLKLSQQLLKHEFANMTSKVRFHRSSGGILDHQVRKATPVHLNVKVALKNFNSILFLAK